MDPLPTIAAETLPATVNRLKSKLPRRFFLLLAGVTEKQLVRQVECRKAENPILRSKLLARGTVTPTDRPRSTLPDYQFASDRQHWWLVNAADTGYPIRGYLRVKTEGDDPHMFGPEGFWAAKDAPIIYVRAAHHTKNTSAQLFWETADKPGFDAKQSVRFDVVPGGKYHTYRVDLSASPAYRGFIRRLRLDPVDSGARGEYVDIEYIATRKK